MHTEPQHAQAVIAGAGIAGVSTAYHLAVVLGVSDVVVCDPLPPLTLTSDKSTECYRNWWPGPGDAMVALMNRSIDLLEDWTAMSGDAFHLSRRGYLYATADPAQLDTMRRQATEISSLGAGDLRIHRGRVDDPPYVVSPRTGYKDAPGGADLFLDGRTLRRHFPSLTADTVGGLHARRAGWFSAQQLGAWLLEQARNAGARLIADRVVAVDSTGDVRAVRLESGREIRTGRFVNACGPLVDQVGRLVGDELPVFSEVHRKISFRDHRAALPRHTPMLIWNDPQTLQWTDAERAELEANPDLRYLTAALGTGAHCRPEGSDEAATVLGLWEYRTDTRTPVFPIPADPLYPEIVLRGLAAMVPAFRTYLDRLPQPFTDGGYYTKTRENRPLIGPTGVRGSFVVGALSGYGVMAAAAAGELAALHVTGSELPSYARWFAPDRYRDQDYVGILDRMNNTGQI